MNKLRWGLLCLAVVCVPALQAGDRGSEAKKGGRFFRAGSFGGQGKGDKAKVFFSDEKKVGDKDADDKRPGAGRRRDGPGAFQLQFGRGGPVVTEKDLEELKLTAEQKEKVAKVLKDHEARQKELTKQLADLRGGGDRAKLREVTQDLARARREAQDKVKAVLNEDQQKKFEEQRRNRGRGFGRGVPGGPGGFGRFAPGQVLPGALKDRLELSEEQKKAVEALEKEVKEKLNKILTDEQKKKLQQGTGRPGGDRPARPRRPGNDPR
jgi:hypothetical protein